MPVATLPPTTEVFCPFWLTLPFTTGYLLPQQICRLSCFLDYLKAGKGSAGRSEAATGQGGKGDPEKWPVPPAQVDLEKHIFVHRPVHTEK